jgi:hypothetical protein
MMPGQTLPLLDEPWPPGRSEPRPCPVCGERWIPWAHSVLPCHARCLFTPEGKRALLAEYNASPLRADSFARSKGITYTILRSAIALGRKQR